MDLPTTPMTAAPPPVVLVTGDAAVLDRVLAVTAALDLRPEVLVEEGRLRAAWGSSSLVLVGLDQAAAVAALVLPRRTEVYLVIGDQDQAEACRWSARVGAAVLTLPGDADGLAAAVAGANGSGAGGGQVVCLVGGSGGAGASTCSAGLAVTAAREGRDVVLVDADERGGGLDLLLGAELVEGWRWPRLAGARGLLGDLRGQLPEVEGVQLLAVSREAQQPALPAEQLTAVLTSLTRSHELVVVDLPRSFSAASRSALRTADLALVVVRADLRGVAAARAAVADLRPACARLAVVVREGPRRGLDPAAVSAALALPLAAVVPYDDTLHFAAERGDPPARRSRSGLARSCRQLLAELGPLGAVA